MAELRGHHHGLGSWLGISPLNRFRAPQDNSARKKSCDLVGTVNRNFSLETGRPSLHDLREGDFSQRNGASHGRNHKSDTKIKQLAVSR